RHLRADAVAVGTGADGLHPNHIVLIAIVIAEQARRTIVDAKQQVEVAVVVIVCISCAASNLRTLQRRSHPAGYIFKTGLAAVTEQEWGLWVFQRGPHAGDVVGDVTV